MMHEKLLTSDRSCKWGLNVDTQCVLCQLQEKNREHVFMKCEYTKKIWNKLFQWLQMQCPRARDGEQHNQWIITCSKGKSQQAQVFKIVFAEVVYQIWNERNLRVFEQRSRQWKIIAKEITYICSA